LSILRNTVTALFSIDPVLRKVSVGMGLTTWQRLRHIELPLAAPTRKSYGARPLILALILAPFSGPPPFSGLEKVAHPMVVVR
jgi:ABC-type nitrate/sulfonate/bicarbonate transport system permease component